MASLNLKGVCGLPELKLPPPLLALLLFETLIARDLPDAERLSDNDRHIIENCASFCFFFPTLFAD